MAVWGEHEKKEAKKKAEQARQDSDEATAKQEAAERRQREIEQQAEERRQKALEEYRKLDEAYAAEYEHDVEFMKNTPEIGKTQEERDAWLDENIQKYANDPIIKELSQTDYEYADEKMIQYVLERQDYEQLQQTVQRHSPERAPKELGRCHQVEQSAAVGHAQVCGRLL